MAPGSGATFDKAGLIEAFEEIGRAAVLHDARLELAVYGGSALMLSSNFRFATEDVDIAEIGSPWPQWLGDRVESIALRNGWAQDWINDAVTFHLSPLANRAADHLEFGSFPGEQGTGLHILVPTAAYMLALKMKAMRTNDPIKGPQESDDIYHLMKVVGVDPAGAIALLRRYFPKSAADPGKQAFLLKHLSPSEAARTIDAPHYGR